MDQLLVIQRYCEQKNIKYELVNNDNNLFESLIDGILRISKVTKSQIYYTNDLIFTYHVKYNSCPYPVLDSDAESDIINRLELITKTYELAECCICYEECRVDLFGCVQCSAITCKLCLIKDKVERNDELIQTMYDFQFDADFIIKRVSEIKDICPVCKIEYDSAEVISERIKN